MAEKVCPKHVFILGSKGIPARYGGFETFVDQLVAKQQTNGIQYHVACATESPTETGEFTYHRAHCFRIPWRPLKSARAIAYDIEALWWAIRYAKKNKLEKPIFYVLACRIGPAIRCFARMIDSIGGTLLINPDGHEWKRAKWSKPVRRYWKLSERLMVKHADLIVCDSRSIEQYIRSEYARYNPRTTYLSYGATLPGPPQSSAVAKYQGWLAGNHLRHGDYYLMVGRFVPENNYELVIREFLRSGTEKPLVIITTDNRDYYNELDSKLNFSGDARFVFPGAVYDQELLTEIRRGAFAYIHGHSVGGTNPSLLEALAATELNLLFDVSFNREVGVDSCLYWTAEPGNLQSLIEKCDDRGLGELKGALADPREVIRERFSWTDIVVGYESLFKRL